MRANRYKKSLKLSNTAMSAAVVNLMHVDTERIWQFTMQMHMLPSHPIIISVGMIELWVFIGVSSLGAIVSLLLIIPVQVCLARMLGGIRREMAEFTDKRTRLTTELLNGIRAVKMQGWESAMAAKVQEIRNKEIERCRSLLFLRSANKVLVYVLPTLAAVTTFVLHVLRGHTLDAGVVFSVLTVITVIRPPLTHVPMAVATAAEAWEYVFEIRFCLSSHLSLSLPSRLSVRPLPSLSSPAFLFTLYSARDQVQEEGGGISRHARN